MNTILRNIIQNFIPLLPDILLSKEDTDSECGFSYYRVWWHCLRALWTLTSPGLFGVMDIEVRSTRGRCSPKFSGGCWMISTFLIHFFPFLSYTNNIVCQLFAWYMSSKGAYLGSLIYFKVISVISVFK